MAGLGSNRRPGVSGDSLRSHFQLIIRGASLYRLRMMHTEELASGSCTRMNAYGHQSQKEISSLTGLPCAMCML